MELRRYFNGLKVSIVWVNELNDRNIFCYDLSAIS